MLPCPGKLQIQMILSHSICFAMLCDQIAYFIHPAILDCLRTLPTLVQQAELVGHHLMKIRCQDDSGAAPIGR